MKKEAENKGTPKNIENKRKFIFPAHPGVTVEAEDEAEALEKLNSLKKDN